MRTLLICFVVIALSSSAALGLINVPSDGSDGAFNPAASVEVDLSQAVTGTWNQAGTGVGVYDPEKWAVVFKYSSVNIPEGVTVTFKNHPSGAPVVWLVQGNATIAGTVSVSGSPGIGPGPGGFRAPCCCADYYPPVAIGLGPGGSSTGAGTYAGVYGSERIVPLIGGSGGRWVGASHGGGALLLAATAAIRLEGSGMLSAYGSGWPGWGDYGSGGAIRLVSDVLAVSWGFALVARSPMGGGNGRIRIETNDMTPEMVPGDPPASMAAVGPDAEIWPEVTAPTIRSVSLGGVAVPGDPRSGLVTPIHADVYLAGAGTRALIMEAENVPLEWHVRVRLAANGCFGAAQYVDAVCTAGDAASSTWEAQIPLVLGSSAIQVRASVE